MTKTILLVEDERIIAMAKTQTIERFGYNVITAHTGEQAVELIKRDGVNGAGNIDLALMDINLGRGMDGTQAASEILKFRDIPIVFLSSHTSQEYVEQTKKITPYGYVVKNSGEFVLQASIDMALKLFQAHRNISSAHEELSAIYQNAPFLMLLLDQERKIHRINRTAREFVNSHADELMGVRFGVALNCVHHLDDPNGCGFGPLCGECAVRNTLLTVFETGQEVRNIEARLILKGPDTADNSANKPADKPVYELDDGNPHNPAKKPEEIVFLLNASHLTLREQPLVLVTLQDLTNTAFQPRS